jgi:hypothetical protein
VGGQRGVLFIETKAWMEVSEGASYLSIGREEGSNPQSRILRAFSGGRAGVPGRERGACGCDAVVSTRRKPPLCRIEMNFSCWGFNARDLIFEGSLVQHAHVPSPSPSQQLYLCKRPGQGVQLSLQGSPLNWRNPCRSWLKMDKCDGANLCIPTPRPSARQRDTTSDCWSTREYDSSQRLQCVAPVHVQLRTSTEVCCCCGGGGGKIRLGKCEWEEAQERPADVS